MLIGLGYNIVERRGKNVIQVYFVIMDPWAFPVY